MIRDPIVHVAPMEIVLNLEAPEYNPPDCPAWAKEKLPPHILPYRGRNGMPLVYRSRQQPLGLAVKRIDRYHANQFVMVRPETMHFLYHHYTPLQVNYRLGTLPAFEALAERVLQGAITDVDKALALLTRGVTVVKHPKMPPCGQVIPADRGMDDEDLLHSGAGWCNEQARVFVRLCQVSSIPARMVHQFYSDEKTGHVVAEFYAGGRWSMADTSWFCVFPDESGRLLSAAECHDRGAGQQACGRGYFQRFQQLLALTDEEINFATPEETAQWRSQTAAETPQSLAAKMNCTAIINYPLPPRP